MTTKVNIEWAVDEVAYDLKNETDLAAYTSAVEREIEAKCLIEGVSLGDVPLDTDGFYDSHILIMYATLLYKKYLFSGYWGSSDGNQYDVYKDKLAYVEKQIDKLLPMITATSIKGLATSTGQPTATKLAVVRQIPYFNGSY